MTQATQAFRILARELQAPFAGLVADVDSAALLDDLFQPLPLVNVAPFKALDQDIFPAESSQPLFEATHSQRRIGSSSFTNPASHSSAAPASPASEQRSRVGLTQSTGPQRKNDAPALKSHQSHQAHAGFEAHSVGSGQSVRSSASVPPVRTEKPETLQVASIDVVNRLTEQILQLIQGTAPAANSHTVASHQHRLLSRPTGNQPLQHKISRPAQSNQPNRTTPQNTMELIEKLTQSIVTSVTAPPPLKDEVRTASQITAPAAGTRWARQSSEISAPSPRQSVVSRSESYPYFTSQPLPPPLNPEFDVDYVTDLVNDALIRQARRYGVDLS